MNHEDFYNKKLKSIARTLRTQMTPTEKKLWFEFLRNEKPQVRRQRSIGNYIVDFYIPKARLVIELDGDPHFLNDKSKADDRERDNYLHSLGLKVIRFTNNDIKNSFESSCKIIKK